MAFTITETLQSDVIVPLSIAVPATMRLLPAGICCTLVGDVIFTKCNFVGTDEGSDDEGSDDEGSDDEGSDDDGNDDVFPAVLLLLVFIFGNNCAYPAGATVCANILERRRMMVPKEKSGSKKKRGTNDVDIISSLLQPSSNTIKTVRRLYCVG